MQERRNALSREIGKVKREGGDADAVMAEVHGLKDGIAGEEAKERDQASVLQAILQELPNIAAEDVPDGLDENDNVELRVVGDKPSLDAEPREHFDLVKH